AARAVSGPPARRAGPGGRRSAGQAASRADDVRNRSPPAGQSPSSTRDQFHRVSGWVTKVKGPPSSRPVDFFLNGDAVALQELPPGVEGPGPDPQGEMACPGGSMRAPIGLRQLTCLTSGRASADDLLRIRG